jgi:hypothetical protein
LIGDEDITWYDKNDVIDEYISIFDGGHIYKCIYEVNDLILKMAKDNFTRRQLMM